MSDKLLTPIEIGLTAAIVAIEDNEPLILTASSRDGDKLAGLPFGPFDAVSHRTFEIGLRAWVEEQTGLRLGYVEQLYTFGDRGRHTEPGDTEVHVASIGYLAGQSVQVARSRVVAETLPRLHHPAGSRPRDVVERGKPLEEFAVPRHDPGDLRLLKHQLGHEHFVRVARPPPRKITCVASIPPSQATAEFAARRRASRHCGVQCGTASNSPCDTPRWTSTTPKTRLAKPLASRR